jgi:O-antigen/teichoic acid export membrane protein
VAVILNAKIILDAWTKSYVVSNDAELVAQVLTIGNCFLAIQYMPYHLAMAHGHSSTNLKIGFWFLIFNPIITVLMVKNYGLIGAALPWPFVNLAGGVILGTLVTKRFLNKRVSEWWLKSVLAPLSVTLIVNLIVYSNSIAKSFGTGDWMVHTFLSVISGLLFLLYGYKLLFNQRLRC